MTCKKTKMLTRTMMPNAKKLKWIYTTAGKSMQKLREIW